MEMICIDKLASDCAFANRTAISMWYIQLHTEVVR